jgi:hypothetical protein
MGCGGHVEQELGPGLAGRHIAQFVEDQEVQLTKLLPQLPRLSPAAAVFNRPQHE